MASQVVAAMLAHATRRARRRWHPGRAEALINAHIDAMERDETILRGDPGAPVPRGRMRNPFARPRRNLNGRRR